ncbi:osmotically inducible protein OsmC [Streptomyces sp. NPDC004042]|uniref:osmotically inducible protein OsmC n=1 Tax=Streptomyces sp. NPDC004042 TaxID=3154451 RepID=UPI0033BD5DC9
MAVTYTARVAVTGEGRNGGTARSEDGLLEHTLAIPEELGGAGGATHPVLGGVDQATAQELAHAAHQICPYSKATRDNIPVTIDATTA